MHKGLVLFFRLLSWRKLILRKILLSFQRSLKLIGWVWADSETQKNPSKLPEKLEVDKTKQPGNKELYLCVKSHWEEWSESQGKAQGHTRRCKERKKLPESAAEMKEATHWECSWNKIENAAEMREATHWECSWNEIENAAEMKEATHWECS